MRRLRQHEQVSKVAAFAVVADEVAYLASRTQESTGEIEEIIAKLHSSAAKAVDAMHIGRDKPAKVPTLSIR